VAGKFKFRLDTVRRVRQRAFEDRQRTVAERQRVIAAEQALGSAAQAQLDEHVNLARGLQQGRIDVRAVRGNRMHLALLHRRIAECALRIAAHERELARERAEMVAARVQVRVLEKLKQRRAAHFAEALQRTENAEQAELALQIHRRRGPVDLSLATD
jgi:flagellar export protein FliJ